MRRGVNVRTSDDEGAAGRIWRPGYGYVRRRGTTRRDGLGQSDGQQPAVHGGVEGMRRAAAGGGSGGPFGSSRWRLAEVRAGASRDGFRTGQGGVLDWPDCGEIKMAAPKPVARRSPGLHHRQHARLRFNKAAAVIVVTCTARCATPARCCRSLGRTDRQSTRIGRPL